ncbi:hypothetical protein Tco_1429246 [Tanacetum coccineum]
MNERQMQSKEGKVYSSKALDASLVVTECSGTKSDKQHTSSSSGNYITHVVDADIRPGNDQVSFAEVQLTAQHNVLSNEQQHSVQFEPSYDTHLLEKVDRNTTLDLTNMCLRGGEIDQNTKKCQVSCPLLDPSSDNKTTEFSNQSLESENISLKKTVAQLQKDFSRMEAHCVIMELKYQNQALKDGKHGKILNETSNKAKIKKENETYEDLYDSIEKTRVQTKDHNDSLFAQINSKTIENADLKAQIQEKVIANVTLKNELRKLKGNNLDTKEFVLANPHHVIAPGSSRNSQEESYGLNDMAHNRYLEEARKKTQERNRNSKSSVKHTTSLQNTTDGSKQKPRINNQTSRSLPISKSSGVMSNKVNSRVEVQSTKTRNSNKPVESTSHTHKPGRQIVTGHRFYPNKSSAVYEKITTPSTCLRWILTGRIFNTVGLSSGLVPNPVSQQPCIPPPRDDWDRLFQPMFNEYFTPSSIVVSPVQEAAAPRAMVLAYSPVLTSIDQDAPSSSTPSTQEQEQSPNISQGFKESPKTPIFHDDPLNESPHEESTSQGSSSNVR